VIESRPRGEDGTALVEVTWLALLLLLPLVYLLVAVFDVQRASYGVSAASAAATRRPGGRAPSRRRPWRCATRASSRTRCAST
jgi:hypothetical protein